MAPETTETPTERALCTIPARAAAVAWLNSFLAASRDPERPALYKNLSLEFYTSGLHLIGCDGTVLFRCWVGCDGEAEWPELDEAPVQGVVATDPDGFGVGYMKTLLQVTSAKGHENEELTITTAAGDDEAAPALGDEFQSERLILRSCGQRLDLRLFEGTYPDWRKLDLGMHAIERVDGLTVAPRIMGLVGKLKDVSAVDLDFTGKEKHVRFEARGSGVVAVRGLLMPMRRPEKPDSKPDLDDEDEE